MLWSVSLFLLVKLLSLVPSTNAGGTFKVALETYRFEVSLTSDDEGSSNSPDAQTLADIDYVKDYTPLWKLKTSLEQDYENATKDVKETAYSYWPWDGPTNCVAPVKFKFLLCFDYAQSYDPSRKCQLGRVQSQLKDISRDRFSATVLGRKTINFGSLMRVLDDGDIITNPVGFDFEEWRGPVRLSIYVNCCGGSRFILDRCDDQLTKDIEIWPQSLAKGIQTMRYSVDGRGRLTFSVSANCETDYYGRSCDVYCKVDKPALEHAMCNSTTGERQCMSGWQGIDCQTDIDECRALMCKNGGSCQNVRGTYSCTCPFGTRGRRCQRRYPVCHLQPCQHQGTCLETPAGSLCFCMPGFDGQWCHQLQHEDETSRKVTGQGSRSHGDKSKIITPTPVRTVLVRDGDKRHKDSSSWHDWYLAIIFGVFILIATLLILLFLLYRAKVRQQYKVTIPESTLLPVQALPKTRVFDNAVYERDDESGIIQPNTFQIFYDSKNITDILNNTNHNNNSNGVGSNINNHNHNTITNDISKSEDKVNNKGVLLSASALIHNKSELTSDIKDKQHAKVKLPLAPSRSPKVENKSKNKKDYQKRNGNVYTDKELRPYSVETIERGGIDGKKKAELQTKLPLSQKNSTGRQSNFYNIPNPTNDRPIIDRWKHIEGVYSSPKSPRSGNFKGSPYQSEYKEPKPSSSQTNDQGNGIHGKRWHTGGSYVHYGASTNSRKNEQHKKRKSHSIKSSEIEHEYEDIESDHGFMNHRPTPKPRSVYNVQCETLKRRYAVPGGKPYEPEVKGNNEGKEESTNNSSTFNQPYQYHRRSSDGLLAEHTRLPFPLQTQHQEQQQQHHLQLQPSTPLAALKSRFDQPRFSEGDIVYPKHRPVHKHYSSQYDLKRKPLSLYVSPEDMNLMSMKSTIAGDSQQNPGYSNSNAFHATPQTLSSNPRGQPDLKNPYSEPRVLNDANLFPDNGVGRSSGQMATPKTPNAATSPRGGSRFDFFRPASRHIYRNTDIEGFDAGRFSPKEPRSPRGWARPKSGEFALSSSSRRKSLVNLSSPPKTDRRRRKSEVMSEKLFRKKLTNELRSDSETSVDKCWWMQDDPRDSVLHHDDHSKMVSSSAFV